MDVKRIPLIVGCLLLLTALTISCIFIKTRPWDNSSQRARFMLKMASELIAPVPEHCLDDAQKKLMKRGLASGGDFPHAKIVLTQGGGNCAKALASCGRCHLPARDGGEYEVHYGEGKTARGRIVGLQDEKLLIASGKNTSTPLDIKTINKSIRLGGSAPWWNFRRFGRRGKTAKRMLLISAAHGVACINCHVRHGEFELTGEGRHYERTRKVIKRVPLGAFK